MAELTTIDDVLSELDRILATTLQEQSALGIFAYVYRRTTREIAEGIEEGRFDDGKRMEEFDVVFAKKYIDAFWKYREGSKVANTWKVAFDAGEKDNQSSDLIIMQHLLLGMNAHINLDLGLAAAQVAPGDKIKTLEDDFMRINRVLKSLIDEIQHRISHVSPLMFLLDWIGKRDDEAVINFSITKARQHAWQFANRLARADESKRAAIIQQTDREMTRLAEFVADPPGIIVNASLSVIRWFEMKDPEAVINTLKTHSHNHS